jgi:hypothetical protein
VAWFDEIVAERAETFARPVLTLVENGPRWRHRRVEAIEPLSATSVRRRVSLDFTVPPELHDGLRMPVTAGAPVAGDQWLVPLGWLARRPLVSFDLRDSEGNSVPLLLASQTAEIMRHLLLLSATEAGLDLADAARTERTLDVVIAAAAATAPGDPRALVAQAAGLGLGPDFTALIRLSALAFLLVAVMPRVEGRQVVKWQTDEIRRLAFPRSGPVYIDLQVVGINEAASTHVELDLPDPLLADSFRLVDRRGDGMVPLPAGERQHSTSDERPRLMLQPVAQTQDPYVRADVLIAANEFLAPALALATLAVFILAFGLASELHELLPRQRATAPSVLLGAFSVGFGLFLRVEENQLVRAILADSRAALGATAVALAVAAIPLALRLASPWVLWTWIAACAVAAVAAFVILWTIMRLTKTGRRFG